MAKKQQRPATPKAPQAARKPAATSYRWITFFILLAAILTVSIIRLNLSSMPLERDEGEYAYLGQLILKGIPPYEMAWNMKLPGTYYMYALIMAIFGQTATGIHVGVLLMNAGMMLFLFFAFRVFYNDRIGLFAACCAGLLMLSPKMQGFAAHATHFVVFFLAGGLFFLSKYSVSRKTQHVFLAGIFLGISLLMKQHAAAFLLFGGAIVLLLEIQARKGTNPVPGIATVIKRGGIFIAGCVLPYLLILLVAKMNGTFDKLWFWTVSYASQYASANTWKDGQNLLKITWGPMWNATPWFYLLVLAGIVLLFLPGWTLRQRVVAVGLLLFGCLAVMPGFHFRHHYMLMLVPAMSLFAAIAVDSALLRFSVLKNAGAKLGVVVVVLFVVYAVILSGDKRYYFVNSTMQLSKSLYRTNPTVEAIDIARYIKKNSAPTDKIAILGSEPEILFYADRPTASGYIYTYNMVEDHDYNLAMQEEMIAEIEKAKPLYIVYVNEKISWLTHPKAPRKIFEWADKYYKENYAVVGLVDIPPEGASTIQWEPVTEGPKNKDNIWIFKRKNATSQEKQTPAGG